MKRKVVMNCFDCATQGRVEIAVAICRRCGAGACTKCVQSHPRSLDQHGSLGPARTGVTRTMLCAPCAAVLADHTLTPAL